jgi:uncharacterized protein YjbI with pentapeptide repeats
MPNDEHVTLLKQGVDVWNQWRRQNSKLGSRFSRPDLREADLIGADLIGADLNRANLSGAKLSGANLSRAKLSGANLTEANLSTAELDEVNLCGADVIGANLSRANLLQAKLSRADLSRADLSGANLSWTNLDHANLKGTRLSGANLSTADLSGANLDEADLLGADLNNAMLSGTMLADANLSAVRGLETCRHYGPSRIDHRTLEKSGLLPVAFLRGIGLPNKLVDHLASLLNQPIQVYSCFISYSATDQEVAERIHADLRTRGVRCHLAPHDVPPSAKILDPSDEAIRLRDKVVLILSANAVANAWAEQEVWRGFAEERDRQRIVLLPIRLDDVVLESPESWACKLRGQRNIGDFTGWKDQGRYQKSLEQLMRDLKVAHDPTSWRDVMSPSH